jgi:hypothetical protein
MYNLFSFIFANRINGLEIDFSKPLIYKEIRIVTNCNEWKNKILMKSITYKTTSRVTEMSSRGGWFKDGIYPL